MWQGIQEKVVVGVITAVVLGGLTLLWNAASSGGLVKLLGGVTADEVARMIDQRPQPTIPSQEQVDDRVVLQFVGAVVAFDAPCRADRGWVPFEDGAGKFLLGAGAGRLVYRGAHHRPPNVDNVVPLKPVEFGDQGGAEVHVLTIDEMPAHTHDRTVGQHAIGGPRVTAWTLQNTGGAHPISPTESIGRGDAHNNMPPYIALYFCKKGG